MILIFVIEDITAAVTTVVWCGVGRPRSQFACQGAQYAQMEAYVYLNVTITMAAVVIM